jgi:hypothetical protein
MKTMILLLLAAACAPSASARREAVMACPEQCARALRVCASERGDDRTDSECFPEHRKCVETCFIPPPPPTTVAGDNKELSK